MVANQLGEVMEVDTTVADREPDLPALTDAHAAAARPVGRAGNERRVELIFYHQHRTRLGCEAHIGSGIEEVVRRQDARARFVKEEDVVGLLVEIGHLARESVDVRRIRWPQFTPVLDMKADRGRSRSGTLARPAVKRGQTSSGADGCISGRNGRQAAMISKR